MNITPIRVLIIEDDEFDYTLTTRLLSQSRDETRFDPHRARTLAEGLALLRNKPQVILLDLTLPDSSGWSTFSRIRAAAQDTPILLLTGLQDEELGTRAIHEGAEDYLIKGHTEARFLIRSILYAIERKHAQAHMLQVAEELRQRNEAMNADLALAREVQHALMPRQYPRIPPEAPPSEAAVQFGHIYLPCRTIGGDFLSLFTLSSHSAGTLICDVMGHGMRAALVTAILRGLMERLRPYAADPAQLLTETNRILVDLLREPQQLVFASAAYVVTDIAEGRFTVSIAGHPPPILLRTGSASPGRFLLDGDVGGPALGIDGAYRYTARQWSLMRGDKLLLFTDGLYELHNPAGQEYGLDRLAAAAHAAGRLPIQALLQQVMAQAEAFAEGSEFDDDICLVGIEIADERRGKRQ